MSTPDKKVDHTVHADTGFLISPACSHAVVKFYPIEILRFAKRRIGKVWEALQRAKGIDVRENFVFRALATILNPKDRKYIMSHPPGQPYRQPNAAAEAAIRPTTPTPPRPTDLPTP